MTVVVHVETPAHAKAVVVIEELTEAGDWAELRREPVAPGVSVPHAVWAGHRVTVMAIPPVPAASQPAPSGA